MGGGLLQLVAYGAQDAYLSGNPQITFWRGLFKRHTNFAMEPFRVNLNGQAAWGTKSSAILGRHADLIGPTYVEMVFPKKPSGSNHNSWADMISANAIKYVELDIGGQIIDRQYSEFMFIWYTLTLNYLQNNNLIKLITAGEQPENCVNGQDTSTEPAYVPLNFFFCRNPGAALPLIALQYHEVKINILWNKPECLLNSDDDTPLSLVPELAQANLVVDYIYLDVEERRRMAQESHEYLIEQLQFNESKGLSSFNNRVDLTFNHPVKELIWVTQQTGKSQCRYSYYDNNDVLVPSPHNLAGSMYDYDNVIDKCLIQLNGQERMGVQNGKYFSTVQPYQHHTGLAKSGVYMYSFAIKPEEHQPSGTCNFSRIDTATLVFNIKGNAHLKPDNDETIDIRVYAINYNILRVMSGMGGLAYSN
uniref:Major capsid protein n=1 Tax=viral metagenome TaxID=1070528 RepID=A0A6C0ENP3_9ZZZZ